MAIPLAGAAPPARPFAAALVSRIVPLHLPAIALVRVPDAALDPRLGLAVLHFRHSRTVIYCAADKIAWQAADALSLLMSRTAEIPGLSGHGGLVANVRVSAVRRSELPEELRPALAKTGRAAVTYLVCSDLITAALADTLSVLLTAQAAYLNSPVRCDAAGVAWPLGSSGLAAAYPGETVISAASR